jgi:hypothetical protein
MQGELSAGCKGNDAVLGVTGARLLRDARVQEMIREATHQVASSAIATRRERQEFLTKLIRGDAAEDTLQVVGIGGGIDHVEHHDKKVAHKDQLKAVEILGRMQGDFIDKVEVKTEASLKASLERLRQVMSPAAFAELLDAYAKMGAK